MRESKSNYFAYMTFKGCRNTQEIRPFECPYVHRTLAWFMSHTQNYLKATFFSSWNVGSTV